MFDPDELAGIAEGTGFSGVAVVASGGSRAAELVAGLADRSNALPNRIDTLFATASATKGFTALTVASLIESGELSFDTTLASLVGRDLPAVDPSVTIEHLLGHTSGVGDYLDEEQHGDIDDHILDVSAHTLQTPDDYLPLLSPRPQVTLPGEKFAYNNSGFVMLSIVIERAGARPFHDLVRQRVFEPAGMTSAAFLRSDELPAGTALGYLENGRTNVFHLPVIGGGDGGVYLGVADMDAFWAALSSGRIVSSEMVATMTAPRSGIEEGVLAYGLGFWLRRGGEVVMLEGMDAGVSFRSAYDHRGQVGYTVMSNTPGGVWPLVRYLDDQLWA